MRKRLIPLALALILAMGLALPGHAAGTGYTDVPEGHWSAEGVRRATELGLFQGVGDGLFGRGQPITRAAFVTALVRLFGWEEVKPAKASFSDVTSDRWFYAAVETAYANDAFVATGGKFRPTEDITREEMAVMLIRSLGYTSLAVTASRYSSVFSDVAVSRGYITMAYDMGIMNGVGDGKFSPDSTATREQAAAVLVRVYDKLHAAPQRLQSLGSYTAITVATPEANLDTAVPTTPLEPLAELYDALRKAKNSGTDLSRAALSLMAGGVRTVVSNGQIAGSGPVSADEVKEILAGEGVSLYYDSRYESAYCIYQPNRYQSATLWYQSGESQAAKLRLAGLFGVTHYLLR